MNVLMMMMHRFGFNGLSCGVDGFLGQDGIDGEVALEFHFTFHHFSDSDIFRFLFSLVSDSHTRLGIA